MLVAEIGLGDLLWTSLWVFMLILFIWIFISIVSDLFRDHELSGWAKAAWVVGLIIFPLLGSLLYLIVRGRGMAERSAAQAQATRSEFDSYVRSVAASSGASPVDDLSRLADLRSKGVITDEEFEVMKARVLSGTSSAP
jgi:signal transduction histidine kinase